MLPSCWCYSSLETSLTQGPRAHCLCWTRDFEVQMLEDTADYYKSKATNWIEIDSCPHYMRKAEDCLKRERDRVTHYLYSSTEQKLVKKVQHELLVTHASQLLEKENSGCRALLRDDKDCRVFSEE